MPLRPLAGRGAFTYWSKIWAMARLLTFFMILALVMTQGSSMAAAVCRHQSLQEHIAARESHDRKAAAVSLAEEEAAAVASKKASQSDDPSSHWPAELLPAETKGAQPRAVEPLRLRPAGHAALPSESISPLLRPPSA
jgi:hypothetical protein